MNGLKARIVNDKKLVDSFHATKPSLVTMNIAEKMLKEQARVTLRPDVLAVVKETAWQAWKEQNRLWCIAVHTTPSDNGSLEKEFEHWYNRECK